jgi:hypothetical protein
MTSADIILPTLLVFLVCALYAIRIWRRWRGW